MTDVSACKSVLLEVLTALGKDLDKLVVVGGWVPDLVFPNRGHIGSLDVDLALDPQKLEPLVYESIRRTLTGCGYQQDPAMSNRFFRRFDNVEVRVDLLTGESFDSANSSTHMQIQDLAVWKARGIDLAFSFQQQISVEGTLPKGGHNRVLATLPTIAAYLCIKAITLSERMKEKDAYDIYFCIDNYPGGYKALAAEYGGILDNNLISEGIAILREKFARLDDIGPVWAAQSAENSSSGTGTSFEVEQRRAYELVNGLLNEIDSITQNK